MAKVQACATEQLLGGFATQSHVLLRYDLPRHVPYTLVILGKLSLGLLLRPNSGVTLK